MKVLVADESGAVAPTCLVFLSYWGHEVEVVRDGLEALRRARAWRPDAIVAATRLERMSGATLVAALRAGSAGGTAAIPVILVGEREEAVAVARAGAPGAAIFLEAPLAPAALLAAISRIRPRGDRAA